MASKNALLGGAQVKVENMSGFDKSGFNAFTAPLGAIVPMRKQLMLPGKFNLSVKISAQLPPLATDAFLRSHLKVEAFLVPLRLCYGGFQSFFSGEQISVPQTNPGSSTQFELTRAKLPLLRVLKPTPDSDAGITSDDVDVFMTKVFGPHTLMDYFGVKWPLNAGVPSIAAWPNNTETDVNQDFNLFPFLAYQLIYHHYYRNKNIERPLFAPPTYSNAAQSQASSLPYVSYDARNVFSYKIGKSGDEVTIVNMTPSGFARCELLNGDLLTLRQRSYGYDYFTTALPSAQEGSPMSVDTSSGSFTISSLRAQNALQHFAEVNQLSSPDYVATNKARYGVDISEGVAQKPILLGSADFPMFTSGVEQTAADSGSYQNPFTGMAARFGRAHAEGNDFVCEGHVNELSYLMVMCSLVPEANYSEGIQHDMRIFTQEGSLVDLPVASLEQVGYEPIDKEEVSGAAIGDHGVFGYQPRYMWHKAGQPNGEVHGLFRRTSSLASFIPQRNTGYNSAADAVISTAFLKVKPTDLDSVMAVSGSLSEYGVMVDSYISLKVVEPLGESVLPSLVDPAYEHGKSVYVSRGASLE